MGWDFRYELSDEESVTVGTNEQVTDNFSVGKICVNKGINQPVDTPFFCL